jgi:hypothetical protein
MCFLLVVVGVQMVHTAQETAVAVLVAVEC